MNNSDRRPIRSREQRSREERSRAVEPSQDDPGSSDSQEEELRRVARDQGFRLVRDSRVGRNKRVRTLLHISVEVRQALELARGQLGLNYSEIVDRSVVMFLESRGLRVEGWSED